MTLTLKSRHLHIYDGRIPYEFANNSEWQHLILGQNERYASSGDFVYIFFARASVVSVILPFLQLHRQRKIAARFFLHGDHHAKVVPLGAPLFRPVQYHRTFLDSVQYENLLHVFTNANSMEPFSGYIIKVLIRSFKENSYTYYIFKATFEPCR